MDPLQSHFPLVFAKTALPVSSLSFVFLFHLSLSLPASVSDPPSSCLPHACFVCALIAFINSLSSLLSLSLYLSNLFFLCLVAFTVLLTGFFILHQISTACTTILALSFSFSLRLIFPTILTPFNLVFISPLFHLYSPFTPVLVHTHLFNPPLPKPEPYILHHFDFFSLIDLSL
ncbi:hypothetical protein BXZ70DRAFT_204650 [Cristinia sonorae]|uniref:Uncharacterized protein n=1 Tax=Cristinia sonorae TaxID=1940300 RepID=A0A8K0UNN7_9AGAR|nr:hypothetical protein BXZ70DRAFT_204650 [Cristinia sonorae]